MAVCDNGGRWRRALVGPLLLALLLGTGRAAAQGQVDGARIEYEAGRSAYEAERFEEALTCFVRAYELSRRPELLYNIAAAHQRLGRPGEASRALRRYLLERPDDPSRTEVEARVASLDLAQRILEQSRAGSASIAAAPAGPSARPARPAPRHRRWWLWAALGGVAALGLGLGVGLGIGLGVPGYPRASDTHATVRF